MAIPKGSEARGFYRAAVNRFREAEYLLEGGFCTGAVYLAGYGVECILKALILSAIASKAKREKMLASFRGGKAHSFEWLRKQYAEHSRLKKSAFETLREDMARVESWTTALRYQARETKQKEAERFLISARVIIRWAEERLS